MAGLHGRESAPYTVMTSAGSILRDGRIEKAGTARAAYEAETRAGTRSERRPNPANALHGNGLYACRPGPIVPVAGARPGIEVLA